jgi:hypothetical protein
MPNEQEAYALKISKVSMTIYLFYMLHISTHLHVSGTATKVVYRLGGMEAHLCLQR